MQNTELQILNVLLDQIIPPRGDGLVPGAGQLGVAAFVLGHAPPDEMFALLMKQIQILWGQGDSLRSGLAAHLEADHPAAFSSLLRLVYMGYYSRGDVRGHLGLSVLPVHPLGYDVASESPEFLDALVAPVVERGACYRAT